MIDTAFNIDLIDDLAREKAVLFLGAGVTASAITAKGGRIAGWEAFLRSMSNITPQNIKKQTAELIEKKDYLLACEILQSALSDDWQRHLVEEFGQKAAPSALHAAIIGLQQRIVVTTNFDKLLEAAWESLDKATHYPTVIPTVGESVFRSLKDHSGKYIIKIHGTVDNADTLVFSRSEYIRLAFGNASYSNFIENLLLNYTFIFIGFSMDDPAIISLMEMYALRYKSARPHYIFTANAVAPNVEEVFKRLRKLTFIKYDGSDHHKCLPNLIENLGREAERRRREIFAESLSST